MVNQSLTALVIDGPPARVAEAFATLEHEGKAIAFEHILPVPTDLSSSDADSWCFDNWGCPHYEPWDITVERNEIMFSAAWHPPLQLLVHVSGLHPEVTLMVDWEVVEDGWGGSASYRAGEQLTYEADVEEDSD